MKDVSPSRIVLSFLVAVLVTTIWGSIVQTVFNMRALVGIGAEFSFGNWLTLVLRDIFSGFTPTYAGYAVLPSLVVGFLVAAAITNGQRTSTRSLWFALAGGLSILVGIPLVNYLAPVALLIGASRDFWCTALMAVGGAVGGVIFATMTRPRPVQSVPPPRDAHMPVA